MDFYTQMERRIRRAHHRGMMVAAACFTGTAAVSAIAVLIASRIIC